LIRVPCDQRLLNQVRLPTERNQQFLIITLGGEDLVFGDTVGSDQLEVLLTEPTDDYIWIQDNFGNTLEMGGVPVPEPTTLSLLAIGGLVLLRRRQFDIAHHGRK
jgi:hypothetical protein